MGNSPRPNPRLTMGVLAAFSVALALFTALPRLAAIDTPPPERLPEDMFADVLGPDMKAGFNLRADTWSGNLPTGETKPIRHQFSRGNDYHFYVSTEVHGARMSVHIYDQDGNLAEDRAWQRDANGVSFAGAEIRAKSTGSYFLILKVDSSPEKETAWAMAYAYK